MREQNARQHTHTKKRARGFSFALATAPFISLIPSTLSPSLLRPPPPPRPLQPSTFPLHPRHHPRTQWLHTTSFHTHPPTPPPTHPHRDRTHIVFHSFSPFPRPPLSFSDVLTTRHPGFPLRFSARVGQNKQKNNNPKQKAKQSKSKHHLGKKNKQTNKQQQQ